jgi:hypothetical protein
MNNMTGIFLILIALRFASLRVNSVARRSTATTGKFRRRACDGYQLSYV